MFFIPCLAPTFMITAQRCSKEQNTVKPPGRNIEALLYYYLAAFSSLECDLGRLKLIAVVNTTFLPCIFIQWNNLWISLCKSPYIAAYRVKLFCAVDNVVDNLNDSGSHLAR
ncbi:hypothetical protein [Escherichia phage IME178]|uniref:Uncharacterized protein n=1 Tax=Escherichia phage IME178 TaxID=2860371 RepID=A0AC61NAV8_9CAUD|nr:hypothetical protein [Escherichia phage IME178]